MIPSGRNEVGLLTMCHLLEKKEICAHPPTHCGVLAVVKLVSYFQRGHNSCLESVGSRLERALAAKQNGARLYKLRR